MSGRMCSAKPGCGLYVHTSGFILTHESDFHFWPASHGGAAVGLDVREDPERLLVERVALRGEGVDVADALCKIIIFRRPLA